MSVSENVLSVQIKTLCHIEAKVILKVQFYLKFLLTHLQHCLQCPDTNMHVVICILDFVDVQTVGTLLICFRFLKNRGSTTDDEPAQAHTAPILQRGVFKLTTFK